MSVLKTGEIKREDAVFRSCSSSQQPSFSTLHTTTSSSQTEKNTATVCFNQQSTIQLHHRIFTEEKPHQCSECGKRFTYHRSLERHKRIHTGEKPYRCSDCGKSFYRQSHLQTHQRVHTGEKPYHCLECRKSFSHLRSLQRHGCIQTEHESY